jgi:hypothetical protein
MNRIATAIACVSMAALGGCVSDFPPRTQTSQAADCRERYACGALSEDALDRLSAKSCDELHAERQRIRYAILSRAERDNKDRRREEKLAQIAFEGLFYFPPSLIVTLPMLAAGSLLDSPRTRNEDELLRQERLLETAYSERKRCPPRTP